MLDVDLNNDSVNWSRTSSRTSTRPGPVCEVLNFKHIKDPEMPEFKRLANADFGYKDFSCKSLDLRLTEYSCVRYIARHNSPAI